MMMFERCVLSLSICLTLMIGLILILVGVMDASGHPYVWGHAMMCGFILLGSALGISVASIRMIRKFIPEDTGDGK